MITGEELFSEIIPDDNSLEQNLLHLYQPFEVNVLHGQSGMQMSLSPWQQCTDDLHYFVQPSHIVSINSLDEYNTQIYGAMVVNTELKHIQEDIRKSVRMGTISFKEIDDHLKETLGSLIKSGAKYKVPMPDLDTVKRDFYTFLMGLYDNDKSVTH